MATTETIRGKFFEDGGVTLMARVVGQTGSAITQASLSSITCKVFDLGSTTPTTAIDTSTLTIANVVFDALQTDSRWTYDTTGYNFRHSPSYLLFTGGNRRYRVEVRCVPVSGDPFIIPYEITSQEIYGS